MRRSVRGNRQATGHPFHTGGADPRMPDYYIITKLTKT
jgi:hypothetical protein